MYKYNKLHIHKDLQTYVIIAYWVPCYVAFGNFSHFSPLSSYFLKCLPRRYLYKKICLYCFIWQGIYYSFHMSQPCLGWCNLNECVAHNMIIFYCILGHFPTLTLIFVYSSQTLSSCHFLIISLKKSLKRGKLH